MYSWQEKELTDRHSMIKLQVCLHVNCGAGKFYIKVPCQMEDRYSASKITRSVFLM